MYNDEHNLYHYTYRKDGSEAEAHSAPQPGPVQDHNSGPQQPVQEMKPVKKNRIGLKVTALALCCALLGGAVVVEQIFSLPGLGQMTLTGINNRDYPVVQGCVLFIACIYVIVNLIVDLLYAYIDPRISYD